MTKRRGAIIRILAPPNAPLHDSKILYYLNDRDEGRYYFCRILANPPMPLPPLLTPQYLTILLTERGGGGGGGRALPFVGFWRPPRCPPSPDATILNYLNDREGGVAPLSFVGFWHPPSPDTTIRNDLNNRERGRQYIRILLLIL